MKFEYCTLFKDVQLSGIFADSKTFADAIPKQSWQAAQQAYEQMDLPLTNSELTRFVAEHFSFAAQPELQALNDVSCVKDYIQALWPKLLRKGFSTSNNSLLALQHDYVVPGGRFNEIYYWDSYFTALGLEDSGNIKLIEAMVDNFVSLIERIGCVPNGNRVYYTSRSQPPVLALMVKLLMPYKKSDIEWLKRMVDAMTKEHAFWHQGEQQLGDSCGEFKRVVKFANGAQLNRYWDDKPEPRPESYAEDVADAEQLPAEQREAFFRNIRAACESGWDFSARWLDKPDSLLSINTTNRVPVDLNALLYLLEKTLSECLIMLEQTSQSQAFSQRADRRKKAILQLLWNDTHGWFCDFDLAKKRASPMLSLAGTVPLFAGIAEQSQAHTIANKLKCDFLRPGGLVSCLSETAQQWDSPNGWAPLQWFAISGLRDYGLHDLAKNIAQRWLAMLEQDFAKRGCLLEKYNVCDPFQTAGGGEYQVQQGFGWTNGVTSRLQVLYQHKL
ncbi:trehalase family glycosidase [Pseudoalteromonas sp. S16_S37]|uniref:trehalase family glycosidase n=1 Tax=Pseudoalteromonas sp. S16_S37 TaxID=2720228 RepID=UPI00168161ED|nr:trehalase family glycosidase [Pseudoalteromonas sp. S16_S37]MBD1583008.1 alpha,alpha-trehalase [Pseudoalteromonas sp. S16_S37]